MKLEYTTIRVFLLLLVWQCRASGQDAPPQTANYVVVAQEFLGAIYPDLNGKGYSLSVESALPYDRTGEPLRVYPQGCANEPPLLPLPSSPEIGPSSSAPPSGPPEPSPSTPRNTMNCGRDPRPTQFLSIGFQFDDVGRLVSFTATGPSVGDRDADNRFEAFIQAHPKMTNAEIVAWRKQSGAKYGPDDKDQLARTCR